MQPKRRQSYVLAINELIGDMPAVTSYEEGLVNVYAEFVKSEIYKQGNSGRGSHMVVGSLALTFSTMQFRTNNDAVSAQMTPTDVKFAEAPFCCYASHVKSAGPEHNCMASVRHIVCGQRTCLLLTYASLINFARGAQGPGATLTFNRIVNFVSGANAAVLKSLVQAGVKMTMHPASSRNIELHTRDDPY